MLITDGEQSEQCSYTPRCADAQSCYDLLVDQEVPKAACPGVGIRTFVIGAPGSEPARSVLSKHRAERRHRRRRAATRSKATATST